MKKMGFIVPIVFVLLLVGIPRSSYDDGGREAYHVLDYKEPI